MPKFKITMPKEDRMLPMYAEAPNAKEALKQVERMTGPLKNAKVTEVSGAVEDGDDEE